MNFRYEMFKYQEIQSTADKNDAGNNKLFPNHFYRGRLYLADSWTSE
jgi:hypothetical protein